MIVNYSEVVNKIEVLTETVEVIRSRIQEHDTGHLYTTISTLEEYIEELNKQLKTLEPAE
jgi:translation initiation factor 1 (eIF-1/SUI1)